MSAITLIVAITLIFPQREWLIPLFGTPISLVSQGKENSPVLLYNMHDNENTSALAGRIISSRYDGEFFELIHTGDRNIGFPYGLDSVWIDPNRIYTDTGVWQQLARNKVTDTLMFETIVSWRDSLLTMLKIHERSLVIALHNNTNQKYSVESYLAGGDYELEADTVFLGVARDMDDFYFVTDSTIFNTLSKGRYHVILQANETVTDDGSLSVYCARLGIPYINVEAQHGHLIRQLRMLIFVYQQIVNEE